MYAPSFEQEFQARKENAEKKEKTAIRKLGQWKGQVWIADDFDETPECFAEYMPSSCMM